MKRKYYITPLVAFSNIEPEADMLIGSPENTEKPALPNDGPDTFIEDFNPKVQEGGDFIPEVE